MPEPLRLRELLKRLTDAQIRFVLVGGLAVNAWGYLRATRDVDLVPDRSPENLANLDELLRELGGKVDVDGRLLAPDATSVFLKTGDRTLVFTDLGRVDILQGLPQIPSFEELEAEATTVDLEGLGEGLLFRAPDRDEAGQRATARP
jgi:predicted nucleotidyltransferase